MSKDMLSKTKAKQLAFLLYKKIHKFKSDKRARFLSTRFNRSLLVQKRCIKANNKILSNNTKQF